MIHRPGLYRPDCQLRAVPQTQLKQNVADGIANGSFRQGKLLGNLLVGHSASHGLNDLPFASADVFDSFLVHLEPGRALGHVGKLVDDLRGHGRGDDRAVFIGDPDAFGQFGDAASFQEVTACSVFQGPKDIFIVIKGGKDDDFYIGPPLFEQSGSLYTIHTGHTNIHKNHIRALLLRAFQRLGHAGYRVRHPDIFADT